MANYNLLVRLEKFIIHKALFFQEIEDSLETSMLEQATNLLF